MCVCGLSCLVMSDSFARPCMGHQTPLSMEFFRQEYWDELPFPLPGNLSNPGIEPTSPALAGRFFTTVPPGKPVILVLTGFHNLNIQPILLASSNRAHQTRGFSSILRSLTPFLLFIGEYFKLPIYGVILHRGLWILSILFKIHSH